MNLKVPAGRYVLGVSGGVDSMVLLNLLSNLPGVGIVVAHFNHGIRDESADDEQLVRAAAERYGLTFEYGRGQLGAETSEETARRARYEFLEVIRQKYSSDKIITAHHQDDLIETAFINLLRGTGRRGLSAIADNKDVLRPLLSTPKKEILRYANSRGLRWREDASNSDTKYLRNYLRHNVLPKMTDSQRREVLAQLSKAQAINSEITLELAALPQLKPAELDRGTFTSLPVEVGNDWLVEWLKAHRIYSYDKKTIERLNIAIRTGRPRTRYNIKNSVKLELAETTAKLILA